MNDEKNSDEPEFPKISNKEILKEVEKLILSFDDNCADGQKIQNIFCDLKEALTTSIVKTQLQKCKQQSIDDFVNKM